MRISDWSSDVCSSDLDEAVRRAPGVVGRMILARDLAPVGRRRIIDARIALRFERDFGQLDAVGERQEEAIDFGAADHPDMPRVGGPECFLDRAYCVAALLLSCRITRAHTLHRPETGRVQ